MINPGFIATAPAPLLLSIVNMKLRDQFSSLHDLARYYDVEAEAIEQALKAEGVKYCAGQNQFKAECEFRDE